MSAELLSSQILPLVNTFGNRSFRVGLENAQGTKITQILIRKEKDNNYLLLAFSDFMESREDPKYDGGQGLYPPEFVVKTILFEDLIPKFFDLFTQDATIEN